MSAHTHARTHTQQEGGGITIGETDQAYAFAFGELYAYNLPIYLSINLSIDPSVYLSIHLYSYTYMNLQ